MLGFEDATNVQEHGLLGDKANYQKACWLTFLSQARVVVKRSVTLLLVVTLGVIGVRFLQGVRTAESRAAMQPFERAESSSWAMRTFSGAATASPETTASAVAVGSAPEHRASLRLPEYLEVELHTTSCTTKPYEKCAGMDFSRPDPGPRVFTCCPDGSECVLFGQVWGMCVPQRTVQRMSRNDN
mmetsp:Transcript_4914/g.12064  ORF Transcript_4914/g.12064 Transcript_4914/m.12064 type:complete len:185 (+) Transcript_4914:214-768(+)